MVNKELNPNFIRKCGVTYLMCRSSRPEVFSRKSVLRNFAKFTGKYPCLCLRAATLLKKRLWHRCFPVNFAILLRTPSVTEHLRWLLLNVFNFSFFWHFLIRYLLLTSLSSDVSVLQLALTDRIDMKTNLINITVKNYLWL